MQLMNIMQGLIIKQKKIYEENPSLCKAVGASGVGAVASVATLPLGGGAAIATGAFINAGLSVADDKTHYVENLGKAVAKGAATYGDLSAQNGDSAALAVDTLKEATKGLATKLGTAMSNGVVSFPSVP